MIHSLNIPGASKATCCLPAGGPGERVTRSEAIRSFNGEHRGTPWTYIRDYTGSIKRPPPDCAGQGFIGRFVRIAFNRLVERLPRVLQAEEKVVSSEDCLRRKIL